MGTPRSVTVVLTRQLERILDRYVHPRARFWHAFDGHECVERRRKSPAAESLTYKNASWTSGLLIHDMQAP